MGRTTKIEICKLLGMREYLHNGKYLGSPFCKFKNKAVEFNYIADKFATKLSGWKVKNLSIAGCNTLIRSVSLAILSYVMQSFMIPVSLCDKIYRLNRRFLWVVKEDEKIFLALQAWENVCVPKLAGGLGLRRARDVKITFVTNWGGKSIQNHRGSG